MCAGAQGTYKQQKDTDKDLVFLHVFPRVEIAEEAAPVASRGGVFNSHSPEYLAAVSSLETFKKMTAAKVRSFSQRKKLQASLKATAGAVEELEGRMAQMEAVSEEEQTLYDNAEASLPTPLLPGTTEEHDPLPQLKPNPNPPPNGTPRPSPRNSSGLRGKSRG